MSAALAVLGLLIAAAVPALAQDAGSAGSRGSPRLLASDVGLNPNPLPFWGRIECEDPSRHELIPTGGDLHPTATGTPQGNTSFRRLRVLDGDDFYGERCELGLNWATGPTAFYREGRRRITALSLRAPPELVNHTGLAGCDADEAGAAIAERGRLARPGAAGAAGPVAPQPQRRDRIDH